MVKRHRRWHAGFHRALIVAASFAMVACCALVSRAQDAYYVDLTGYSYSESQSAWIYEYDIVNPSSSPDSVWSYDLDGTTGVTRVTGPADWTILDSTIPSWDANNSTAAVSPNETQTGFQVTSTAGPGTVTWILSDYLGHTREGSVTGPVTPEPSTLALMGVGLASFAFMRRRRGSRSRESGTGEEDFQPDR